MLNRAFAAVVLCVSVAAPVWAQISRSAPEPPASAFGSVSGHVYLTDSNAPARFAEVMLQPVAVESEPPFSPGQRPALAVKVYQVGLDGGYTCPRVPPGQYYVVVNRPGYLSPFAQFTREELEHPTPEVQRRIDAALPVVSVVPNTTTTRDIRLLRGASISGTVRFDDGTSYAGTRVQVLARGASGKWVSVVGSGARTDSDGRYRVDGLFGGDYLLRVAMSIDDKRKSDALSASGSSSSSTHYQLDYYGAGDALRQRDAKPITLSDGQDATSEDITIPVSQLHAISGAVVDAESGAALNAGTVRLVWADDGSQLASAPIDVETRTFRLDFVPEGKFRLEVRDARDVRREAVSPQAFPAPAKEVVLRSYAPGEVDVTVTGEVSGESIAVKPRGAGANAVAAQ